MLRVAFPLAAAALVALTALPAAAAAPPAPGTSSETPIHFMKRFFKEPVDVLTGKTPTLRERAAANGSGVPAPGIPLPHLRPTGATATAVAAAAPEMTRTGKVPEPHLRPNEVAMAAAPATVDAAVPPAVESAAPPAPDATLAASPPVPEPRLRPDKVAIAAPPTVDAPAPPAADTKLAAIPPEPTPAPPAPATLIHPPPPAAGSVCGAAIAKLGVMSTALAAIREGKNDACTVPEPVAVAALDRGAVDFSSNAIVGCPLAETLANWIDTQVEPAALAAYGEHLTGLRIADAYSCRTRDSIKGAKLSEHAKGNAIDISAFRVGDRWIEVKSGWQAGGTDLAFLTEIRKSACGPFKTVLGPGSDSYHTDHIHLDLAARRTSGPSRGLVCP